MNGLPTPPAGNGCPNCEEAGHTPSVGTTNTCGSGHCRVIERLKTEIVDCIAREEAAEAAATQLQQQNTQLAARNTQLEEELARGGRVRHTIRTWQQMLRNRLQPPNPAVAPTAWDDIYKQCCREENMSVTIEWIHPNIRLVPPGILGPPDLEQEAATPVPATPFPFEGLPWNVQAEIFKMWLFKEGQLVHALSRLDKFTEPQTFPTEDELRRINVPNEFNSGLPRGFYWGKTLYNVTDDRRDPNDVLRLLLVSRRLYFIGVHCFYGLNTFAFSSLGEFERFANGIGYARLARMQHVEIALQGNQFLTIPIPTNKKRIPFSRRTFGLYLLRDIYRLRTLVIHLNESGQGYIRQGYEPDPVKKFAVQKTAGQPNTRMSRSLRCLQALDCIHQLRGLAWIRFYDLFKAIVPYTGERVQVRDWSFIEDITNTTTMQKVPSRLETSRLENLRSLFRDGVHWTPSDDDWAIAKAYYIGDNVRLSYDNLRRHGHHQDIDVPSNGSATNPTDRASSDSDDDSDDDDSSSSSSGGGGGRGGRGGRGGDGRGRGGGGRGAAAKPRARAANVKKPSQPILKRIILRVNTQSSEADSSSDSSDTDSNSDDSDSGIPPRRPRGGPSKGGPSKGGPRRRNRESPDLDELLEQIRNGQHSSSSSSDSDSSDSSESSDSDDSDSDSDSDDGSNVANRAGNSIFLLTDDEEDEVIVLDSDDDDDESQLFVSPNPPSETHQPEETPSISNPPGQRPSTQWTSINPPAPQANRDDWRHASASITAVLCRALSSRQGTGSTATPPIPPRRSTSSGLFVSQSSTPNPSIKLEDSLPIISPDSANERIDLTGSETTVLPPIREGDEDDGQETGTSHPGAGSKRASPDEDAEEGDGEGGSPKRRRSSSPGGGGEAGGEMV